MYLPSKMSRMVMFITRLPLIDPARTPTMPLLSPYRGMPEENLEVFTGFY